MGDTKQVAVRSASARILGLMCFAITSSWAAEGAAATITVNLSSSSTTAPDADDGKCDIVEAVRAANTDAAVHTGDCPAGSGEDQIVLSPGAVYRVNSALRLTTPIAISVSGGGRATIKPANTWNFGSNGLGDDTLIYAEHVASTSNGNPIKITDVSLVGNGNYGVTGFGSNNTFATLTRVIVSTFENGGIKSFCEWGGLCDNGSSLTLQFSSVTNNYSSANGAGIASFGEGSGLNIHNSSITGNVSGSSGGGIYLGGGPNIPNIVNSTISDNEAYYGGGLYVDFVQLENTYVQIMGSTIATNHAYLSGGGIYFLGHLVYSHDIKINASIVNNNTSDDAAHPNVADINEPSALNIQCFDNSLIYVPPGGTAPLQLDAPGEQCVFNIPDAKLGPLMDMGGNGLPVHALLSNSPALDVVVDTGLLVQQRDIVANADTLPPTWQLWDRNYDGNADNVARRDAGAFEYSRRWQTELLKLQAKGSAALTTVTSPSSWDRGAGQSYAATSNSSQFVTYVVPIAEAKNYNIEVGVMKHKSAGIFQLAVATSPSGPWTNVGTAKDCYQNTTTLTPAAITISTSQALPVGQNYFRFTVTNKNGSSLNYNLNLDYIRLGP